MNRLADAFLKIEILSMSSGYNSFQEKLIEESGLSEESADTILEMKSTLSEYRDCKSKQDSKKSIRKTK